MATIMSYNPVDRGFNAPHTFFAVVMMVTHCSSELIGHPLDGFICCLSPQQGVPGPYARRQEQIMCSRSLWLDAIRAYLFPRQHRTSNICWVYHLFLLSCKMADDSKWLYSHISLQSNNRTIVERFESIERAGATTDNDRSM